MNEYQDKFSRIIDLLKDHSPRGLSISALARELGMNRATVSKYLEVLQSSGDVSMQRFGRSKLYTPAPRVPLSELFDRLSNAIVILDADLHILMVNTSFIKTLGIHRERNVIGVPLFDLNLRIFSDPAIMRNIERVWQSGTYLSDMQYIEDSTNHIYHIEFAPTVSHVGKPGIMISLQDITAWKNTETVLKNSEKKIRTIFETVPSGIIFFTAEGVVLNANRASLDILGLKKIQELANGNIFEIACYKGKILELIRQGKVAETELACDFDRLKRDQGISSTRSGIVYFDVVFTPITSDGGGIPNEFAILFKDITIERLARKELAFKEIRYRSFFENTCNGVLIYEPIDGGNEYIFKDVNRATEKILQMQKTDLVGRKLFEVFPDLPNPDVREALIRVLETEKPEFLPPLQYRKEHSSPWIWHYIFKLPSGEIASFMIDISGAVREEAEAPLRACGARVAREGSLSEIDI
ncbi:PAS domain-containing protein [Methanoculleus sp. UBA416]|jgi:PAS domain S-box-containing protein|uniref:PAS domain-containing protein n=2 Tax=unclassified Methanoculleus TaxID=2619537 RepID=UPI00319DB6BB